MPTGQRLVIVESPAKAKTIAGYLDPGYVVESTALLGALSGQSEKAAPGNHRGPTS